MGYFDPSDNRVKLCFLPLNPIPTGLFDNKAAIKVLVVFEFFFYFLSFEGICCSVCHFDPPVGIGLSFEFFFESGYEVAIKICSCFF